MSALAGAQDVIQRLEEAPTPEMLTMIDVYLLSVSNEARFFGNPGWIIINVPSAVQTMVADATARFMRNPDGYSQNRSADETIGWQDRPTSDATYFTQGEVERLQRIGNPKLSKFGSFQVTAYQAEMPPGDIYVPDADGGAPFPLFAGPRYGWPYRRW